MSFILDALKKLEREKEAREPGVVMVGPVPWGGRDRRRRARTLVLAAAALGVVVMGALWWLQAEPAPTPPVDRDAAQTSEPSPAEASAPAATTLPPAGEAVVARPSASRDRRATTAVPPVSAPTLRELDLPSTPPAPARLTPSQATTPEEIAPAVVETVPESPVEQAEGPVGTEPESAIEPAPAQESTGADPVFRLTAISTRDGEPIALLNDRLVREGDSFGGVRVLRIGATDVEIEVDGERRTIGF